MRETKQVEIRRKTAVSSEERVLTVPARQFLGELHTLFADRISDLLERREARQAAFDRGELPDFLPETAHVRDGDWTVAPQPGALECRVVEITGPVDRKMIINALGSGADVFMADFEDSSAPTWEVVIEGQANLQDAVRGTITYTHPRTGKLYELGDRVATLFVRPRGLHLLERHVCVDGEPIRGALFDFGLFAFHNAAALAERGAGPFFYLPKLQSHLEARLWNDVMSFAEESLGIAPSSMRATVLIETLPAAFEMDEILYELRDHSAGLNCGRWDYIFSYIKTLRNRPEFVIPDRAEVGMTQPNMRAYTQLLIKTCHRRGAFAMGGMAAQIPIKSDPEANAAALDKVRRDKEREAGDGHDGTWVAHPGLVAIARDAFESALGGRPNQLERQRDDVEVSADDLLAVPEGGRTEAALRTNIRVGIHYLESWLRGVGCVPLYHLMEDAATAEISRTQIWQWLRHRVATDDGRAVDAARVAAATADEMKVIADEVGAERFAAGKYEKARDLFLEVATRTDSFPEFLTLPAYELLVTGTITSEEEIR